MDTSSCWRGLLDTWIHHWKDWDRGFGAHYFARGADLLVGSHCERRWRACVNAQEMFDSLSSKCLMSAESVCALRNGGSISLKGTREKDVNEVMGNIRSRKMEDEASNWELKQTRTKVASPWRLLESVDFSPGATSDPQQYHLQPLFIVLS